MYHLSHMPIKHWTSAIFSSRPICDEDTDTTSGDSEEEIIEEFGSSDDTLDGKLHPQLTTNHHTQWKSGRLMEKCVYLTVIM